MAREVYVAVVGLTGSGKSSFISKCSGQSISIGHSLHSDTSDVEVITFTHNGNTINLVDTPGFDDSDLSDAAILELFASWLVEARVSGVYLDGLVYLHRISDNKMSGSSVKCLRLFQNMCGAAAYPNVVLGSSMWDRVSESEGVSRENELVNTESFWGSMVAAGSKTFRFRNDKASSICAIDHIAGLNQKITPLLQYQLVDEGKHLNETEAGLEVDKHLQDLGDQYLQQLKDAQDELRRAENAHINGLSRELEGLVDSLTAQLQAATMRAEALESDAKDLLRHQRQDLEREVQRMQRNEEDLRNRLAESQRAAETPGQSSGLPQRARNPQPITQPQSEIAKKGNKAPRTPPSRKLSDNQKLMDVQKRLMAKRRLRINKYYDRMTVITGALNLGIAALGVVGAAAACTVM